MPLVHTRYPAIDNDLWPVSRAPAPFPSPPLLSDHSGGSSRRRLRKLNAVHEAKFMQQMETLAGY